MNVVIQLTLLLFEHKIADNLFSKIIIYFICLSVKISHRHHKLSDY